MKRFLIALFASVLLLCSCKKASVVTEPATEAVVTADTEIFLSAAGFENVYDESLDAVWIYRPEVTDGFYTRILVYSGEKISFRVLCTDASYFEYNGKKYEIKDNDVSADKSMIRALQSIANGGKCSIGSREITEAERNALSATLELYNAAYNGTPYSERSAVKTDANGNAVYECDGFTISYPVGFNAYEKNGELIITSDTEKAATVSIKHIDTVFSPVLSDKESVKKNVEEQGGKLISEMTGTTIGTKSAYVYKYEKDGIYITQYFADGGTGTYILTAGSYDKDDTVPESVISTFEVKNAFINANTEASE